MKDLILEKLKEIEQNENIKILLAVESGSRAWGFASPDSDYDVRFIYVRPINYYLRLDKTRDVIELPINDKLDINGWDLKKALTLLHNSNPTLFEWLSSPIVYYDTGYFDKYKNILNNYFSSKKSLYHYLHTAENTNRNFLNGEIIRLKKYFYALRPILACKYIIGHNSPPPVLFSKLVETELPNNMKPDVQQLLDFKINMPEIKEINRFHTPISIENISNYIKNEITNIKQILNNLPSKKDKPWDDLNDIFLSALNL